MVYINNGVFIIFNIDMRYIILDIDVDIKYKMVVSLY